VLVKEAVQFSTRGVEGVLCGLGDGWPDEETTVVVDEIEQHVASGLLGKVGMVMAAADDFASEHLEMITVAGKGLIGESLMQQIDQEGLDRFNDALADGKIAVLNLPECGPQVAKSERKLSSVVCRARLIVA
jgi:hypothetical protein